MKTKLFLLSILLILLSGCFFPGWYSGMAVATSSSTFKRSNNERDAFISLLKH